MVASLGTIRFTLFEMTDKILVLSTCASADEAEKLARLLVERRLAACVSVVPQARSYFRWKGEVEMADECLLLIKSARELFEPLRAAIEAEHSYETPEVVAIPILAGARGYLNWMDANLETGREPVAE